MFSGDYSGQRHSPLKQITPQNAHRLAAQWTFQTGVIPRRGFEGTPLVADGVVYVTGPFNNAWALDAQTGRPFWRYQRELPTDLTYGAISPVNRGFGMLGTRLFMLTADAHLVALDAQNRHRALGFGDGRLQDRLRRDRRAARRQGQGDRRHLRRRFPDPRVHRRLRSGDRQTDLALLDGPGSGRARQRDLAGRGGDGPWRRRRRGSPAATIPS